MEQAGREKEGDRKSKMMDDCSLSFFPHAIDAHTKSRAKKKEKNKKGKKLAGIHTPTHTSEQAVYQHRNDADHDDDDDDAADDETLCLESATDIDGEKGGFKKHVASRILSRNPRSVCIIRPASGMLLIE